MKRDAGGGTAAALLSSTWLSEETFSLSVRVDSSLERRRDSDIAKVAGAVAVILIVGRIAEAIGGKDSMTCVRFVINVA